MCVLILGKQGHDAYTRGGPCRGQAATRHAGAGRALAVLGPDGHLRRRLPLACPVPREKAKRGARGRRTSPGVAGWQAARTKQGTPRPGLCLVRGLGDADWAVWGQQPPSTTPSAGAHRRVARPRPVAPTQKAPCHFSQLPDREGRPGACLRSVQCRVLVSAVRFPRTFLSFKPPWLFVGSWQGSGERPVSSRAGLTLTQGGLRDPVSASTRACAPAGKGPPFWGLARPGLGAVSRHVGDGFPPQGRQGAHPAPTQRGWSLEQVREGDGRLGVKVGPEEPSGC